MPCHISDGPQTPEDVPGWTDEPDPDAAYDENREFERDAELFTSGAEKG